LQEYVGRANALQAFAKKTVDEAQKKIQDQVQSVLFSMRHRAPL